MAGMDEGGARDLAADRFEAQRPHLRSVAFRMLGSLADAEDAVQEAWLRLDRAGAAGVENLPAWLTTVVSRICLDMLRTRASRREISEEHAAALPDDASPDPEREAVLVDAVGRALLVVLDRLSPAERVAFVLHDMFSVPFTEIGVIVDRTPATAKKLASRARLRVTGVGGDDSGGGNASGGSGSGGSGSGSGGSRDDAAAEATAHRRVVESFLAAARGRDIAGLLAVLDPAVVRRADAAALPAGVPLEVRGAQAVVEETLLLTRNALAADLVLVDGRIGLVVAPRGRLALALLFEIADGRIVTYSVVAAPEHLARLTFTVPPGRLSPRPAP